MSGSSRLGTRIKLAPYDPAWPEAFLREACKIRAALGGRAIAVHHAGSTSVPGLSAKPILDIVLAVEDSKNEEAYLPALANAGFRLHLREPGWFEHRLLKGSAPAVNLHVFTNACAEIDRMLLFRDWLREHADDRLLYEAAKRELSTRTWPSTQAYADAKTHVVAAILQRALAARGS